MVQISLAGQSWAYENDWVIIWEHPLMISVYAAAGSLLVVALAIILRIFNENIKADRDVSPTQKTLANDTNGLGLLVPNDSTTTGEYDFSTLARELEPESQPDSRKRTLRIILIESLRMICCAALVALSVVAVMRVDSALLCAEQPHLPGHAASVPRAQTTRHIELILSIFYAYTTVLSLIVLILPNTSMRGTASQHLTSLLVVNFGVYLYRDIYPLARLDGHPDDHCLGWITWARSALVGFAGIVLPVIIPRAAVSKIPNQEEVSSILSLITYSFLDPVIWKAFKIPHLPYEKLPVLSDGSKSAHLCAESFPLLDPIQRKSKRHIFFGFLHFFSFYWITLALTTAIQVLFSFIQPLAIYQILHFVETGGDGATIKPWFWVGALFLGGWLKSIGIQWYLCIGNRMVIRTEGILTSLIFEHALRIRIKEGDSSKSRSASGITTPDTSDTEFVGTHEVSSPTNDTTDAATKKNEDESSNFVGRINNLISSDMDNILKAQQLPWFLFSLPLRVGLSISFLYVILGWSAFVGLGFTILAFFVPGLIARSMHSVQVEKAKRTDERVQAITETINVIRMVKAFGWEEKTRARINERREDELKCIRRNNLLILFNNNANWILPLVTLMVVFFSYSVIAKKALNASTVRKLCESGIHNVFSALGVMESMRSEIHRSFQFLPQLVQAKVSIDRVNKYLQETELLDEFDHELSTQALQLPDLIHGDSTIGFRNASFTWSKIDSADGAVTPRRDFTLRINDELLFKRNALNIIVGPTGCGKSSLLLSLLGELHFNCNSADSWYRLPREDGIAYCPQEPWILNLTIKENIIFGSEFDAERYQTVLNACALDQDLKLFKAGDSTEVGERGLTLSGGQKARLSLARAVYSSASIVLLDDILSALDIHTAKSIVDHCILGNLLLGRTVILVTHNVALVGRFADRVISVSTSGVASVAPNLAAVMVEDRSLRKEFIHEPEAIEKAEGLGSEEPNDNTLASGQLVAEEETALGRISSGTIMYYLSSLGGPLFWLTYFSSLIISELSDMWQIWWIGYWARQYETQPAGSVDTAFYLGMFAVSIIFSAVTYSASSTIWIFAGIKASKTLHDRLLKAVLSTTIQVLDRTPVGRLIQRFTKDTRAVDGPLTESAQGFCHVSILLMSRLLIIVYFTPAFLIPGIILAFLGIGCGQLYMRAQLPVKREMSNAKGPVFSHFGAAIHGLTSIRAYGVQSRFNLQLLDRIDKYSRTALTFQNLNRWCNHRIDFLGSLFCSGLAGYLIYVSKTTASSIGFQLNLAVVFSFCLLIWVRDFNDLQVEANSVERIQAYIDIEQEPAPTKDGEPPAAWPASGELRIEKLCARYSPEGPDVLHELSFKIGSGQKVGVVGRTGSGKSSLALRLLRLIEGDGDVFFDGIPTSQLNLEALRSNITTIPQQPELLAGSIRQNLDPFEEHSDAILNDTLRAVGLSSLQSGLPEAERISLDSSVSSGGANFSLGQRQILALARALVRRSKILILDEATASLDYKTDELIQESLRTQFQDCTVITIAHRLQTIMDAHNVIVLDAGRLVEFDSPSALLEKGGFFKSLVDESEDKEVLYEIAQTGYF